ncbi:MAG TPA: LysE family translocator [Vineibacter sp.]|nr:LysE family translocator [Vineibacter sp.]
MDITSGLFLAYLSVSAVVIMTPGPDTALTIRNSLLGGRSGGTFTALGVASGQAIWALATSAGLVTLLLASEPLFAAVKLAGAAYLIGLGVVSLWSAFRGSRRDNPAIAALPRRRQPAGQAFRQGLVSNLGNPKMAVFFTSLLPQFSPAGEQSFAALGCLGLVFCIMTFAWLALYAVVIDRAGAWLHRTWVQRGLEGLTGAVLIGLGWRLTADHR